MNSFGLKLQNMSGGTEENYVDPSLAMTDPKS